MKNLNPTWTDADWHRQATYVGFDTDEEEDYYRHICAQQKANDEAANLEAERRWIEAEEAADREETEWLEAANFLAIVDYGEADGALADWAIVNQG